MFPHSAIDAGIIQAICPAHDWVQGAVSFTLRVAVRSAAHKRACPGCGAASMTKGDADSGLERNRRCVVHINGGDPHRSNPWPGETSDLLFGFKPDAAKTPGRALKRIAVGWSDVEGVPRSFSRAAQYRWAGPPAMKVKDRGFDPDCRPRHGVERG